MEQEASEREALALLFLSFSINKHSVNQPPLPPFPPSPPPSLLPQVARVDMVQSKAKKGDHDNYVIRFISGVGKVREGGWEGGRAAVITACRECST